MSFWYVEVGKVLHKIWVLNCLFCVALAEPVDVSLPEPAPSLLDDTHETTSRRLKARVLHSNPGLDPGRARPFVAQMYQTADVSLLRLVPRQKSSFRVIRIDCSQQKRFMEDIYNCTWHVVCHLNQDSQQPKCDPDHSVLSTKFRNIHPEGARHV